MEAPEYTVMIVLPSLHLLHFRWNMYRTSKMGSHCKGIFSIIPTSIDKHNRNNSKTVFLKLRTAKERNPVIYNIDNPEGHWVIIQSHAFHQPREVNASIFKVIPTNSYPTIQCLMQSNSPVHVLLFVCFREDQNHCICQLQVNIKHPKSLKSLEKNNLKGNHYQTQYAAASPRYTNFTCDKNAQ